MIDAAKIRRLLLQPQATYRHSEAAALLGMAPGELRERAEAGEIEMEDGRVAWAELVSFAMDFWPQETVEEALGCDVAEAIPEPLRLAAVRVRIPRMQLVVLERLAAAGGETISAVLARELRDLVSTHAERLDAEVPDLAKALVWPDGMIPAPKRRSPAAVSHKARSRRAGAPPKRARAGQLTQMSGQTARRAP